MAFVICQMPAYHYTICPISIFWYSCIRQKFCLFQHVISLFPEFMRDSIEQKAVSNSAHVVKAVEINVSWTTHNRYEWEEHHRTLLLARITNRFHCLTEAPSQAITSEKSNIKYKFDSYEFGSTETSTHALMALLFLFPSSWSIRLAEWQVSSIYTRAYGNICLEW